MGAEHSKAGFAPLTLSTATVDQGAVWATASVQRLLLFRLAISGRLFERKNDDFFTRVGTDIVV